MSGIKEIVKKFLFFRKDIKIGSERYIKLKESWLKKLADEIAYDMELIDFFNILVTVLNTECEPAHRSLNKERQSEHNQRSKLI